MTLREEILRNSGLLCEDNAEKKWVNTFEDLFAKELGKNGREYSDFAGSKEYREWVTKVIEPLLKDEVAKKAFEKWEKDLLFDLD